MPLARRDFLNRLTLAAGLAAAGSRETGASEGTAAPIPAHSNGSGDWASLRSMFRLSPDDIHMGALLNVSHPEPVRDAIEAYRRELDETPVLSLQEHNRSRQRRVREAAARYLDVDADDIALTDSTTMGIALVLQRASPARRG